ncbi:MAG: thioredoxin [Acidobacteria bacterium]|nr:thioredoxin [Acidobacteriota bacterium]
MSEIFTFNSENFEREVIKSDIPVLVDFWAEWCVPCKMITPIVEKLAEEYKGRLKVGKVNVDEEGAIAARYRIRSIPTLLLFDRGEVREQIIGVQSKEAIDKRISPYVS